MSGSNFEEGGTRCFVCCIPLPLILGFLLFVATRSLHHAHRPTAIALLPSSSQKARIDPPTLSGRRP